MQREREINTNLDQVRKYSKFTHLRNSNVDTQDVTSSPITYTHFTQTWGNDLCRAR